MLKEINSILRIINYNWMCGIEMNNKRNKLKRNKVFNQKKVPR